MQACYHAEEVENEEGQSASHILTLQEASEFPYDAPDYLVKAQVAGDKIASDPPCVRQGLPPAIRPEASEVNELAYVLFSSW